MIPIRNLATVYRPAKWEDVVGQPHVVDVLKNQALKKIGLTNAYLFYGSSGVGKTTIARIFANALNCEALLPTGNPCGQCYMCRAGDVAEINCAVAGGVNDIRNYIEQMRVIPEGNYNLKLLDECHKLSEEAINALLKPLEDGNDRAIWLFATSELKLPPTFLSRCRIFKLNDLSHIQIIERLKEIAQTEKIEISEKDLTVIAKNSINVRQAITELAKYSNAGTLDSFASEVANQNDKSKNTKNEKIILTGIQPQIIEVLKALGPEVKNEKLKLPIITKKLNMPDVSGKQIAGELRALGLNVPSDKKINGVSYLEWDSPKLANIFKAYNKST